MRHLPNCPSFALPQFAQEKLNLILPSQYILDDHVGFIFIVA